MGHIQRVSEQAIIVDPKAIYIISVATDNQAIGLKP